MWEESGGEETGDVSNTGYWGYTRVEDAKQQEEAEGKLGQQTDKKSQWV